MNKIYSNILASINKKEKLLAVLLDPDKVKLDELSFLISKINQSIITHIFVGGSTVNEGVTEPFVKELKTLTNLPIIIFPGDVGQITNEADAILFLSLISGRNPDYLIEKQVQSISRLRQTNIEIISTGYMLVESGTQTTVERISNTKPMALDNVQLIVDTAKAGELLGMKLIYLEAGSGALNAIDYKITANVKTELNIPLIVGGGIRNQQQLNAAYSAGADLVVIGTAFEKDENFFKALI